MDCYIDALTKALAKRGLPRKLYVDNGPAFSTQVLRHAMASLGIALIHSRPYQPEGRGKIERFFKSVRMQFLSTIPDGLALQDLNKRLKTNITSVNTAARKRRPSPGMPVISTASGRRRGNLWITSGKG